MDKEMKIKDRKVKICIESVALDFIEMVEDLEISDEIKDKVIFKLNEALNELPTEAFLDEKMLHRNIK